MILDVQAVGTVDFSGSIQRRLTDAERKPLRRLQTDALALISGEWRGWRYRGRPPSAPRNVSLAKWKGKIQTTEADHVSLTISNAARSWDTGQPYVAQVERRRGAGSEADRVIEIVARDLWPVTVAAMRDEIVKALSAPSKPQKLRRNSGSAPTVNAAPIIL